MNAFVLVCMTMYLCTCMHACVYMCTYVHNCVYTCAFVSLCVNLFECTYKWVHARMCSNQGETLPEAIWRERTPGPGQQVENPQSKDTFFLPLHT